MVSMHDFRQLPQYLSRLKKGGYVPSLSDNFFDVLSTEKRAAVAGLSASGEPHLGHLIQVKALASLQLVGFRAVLALSDVEADLTRERTHAGPEDLRRFSTLAQAGGLDVKKTEVYLHSRRPEVIRLADQLGEKLDPDVFTRTYGSEISSSKRTAMQHMLADVFTPTVRDGRQALVVLGIDEKPHYELMLRTASHLDIPRPGALFLGLLPGLTGTKMSKSVPETCIGVFDDPVAAGQAVKNSSYARENPTDSLAYLVGIGVLDMDPVSLRKKWGDSPEGVRELVGTQLTTYLKSIGEL